MHYFLLKAFPEQYEARAEETRRALLPHSIASLIEFL
jgi:hypothetical protein